MIPASQKRNYIFVEQIESEKKLGRLQVYVSSNVANQNYRKGGRESLVPRN